MVRMHPTETHIKDDLDTVYIAIDRLRVLSHAYDGQRYAGMRGDFNLARRALIALANIRERLANSVPVEQGEMEIGELIEGKRRSDGNISQVAEH